MNRAQGLIVLFITEHPRSTYQEIALKTLYSYGYVYKVVQSIRHLLTQHRTWPRTFSVRAER